MNYQYIEHNFLVKVPLGIYFCRIYHTEATSMFKLPYILENKVGIILNSRDFWTRLFSRHAFIGFILTMHGRKKVIYTIYEFYNAMISIENLNQNKCSTLRVEHGRNGSARAA